MSLTLEQALAQIDFAFDTMLAPYLGDPVFRASSRDNLRAILLEKIDAGASVPQAMAYITQIIGGTLAVYSQQLPISEQQWSAVFSGYDYLGSLDSSDLVALVYPAAFANDHAIIINALQKGYISNAAFLQGFLAVSQSHETPGAIELITAIAHDGAFMHHLPDVYFDFPELTNAHVSFLVGIYIAAFNRAPEYEGLQYWASKLATYHAQGLAEIDAYKAVTRDIHWAGENNGEAGTGLGNADYVIFVYDTVLGREPDPSGHDYWLRELDSGSIPRSEFLTVFLVSALHDALDGAYLEARIAVAKFAAQEDVSGPGAPLVDLVGILHETNAPDPATAEFDTLPRHDLQDDPYAHVEHHDPALELPLPDDSFDAFNIG